MRGGEWTTIECASCETVFEARSGSNITHCPDCRNTTGGIVCRGGH